MISIIVPIYNVEKYLEECLLSIQNQTYRDFECIMVNDGSPDSSAEIAQRFEDEDVRFKLITQENKGLSAARNTGLKHAKGKYITFVDSDDAVKKDFLQNLLKHMQSDIDIVECRSFSEEGFFDIEEKENIVVKEGVTEALRGLVLEKKLAHSAWGKLYKKELFNEVRFPEGLNYEDLYVYMALLKKIGKVVKINYAGYFYRKNENSIMNNTFNQKNLDIFTICRRIEDVYFEDKENSPLVYRHLFSCMVYHYLNFVADNNSYKKLYEEYLNIYSKKAYNSGVSIRIYRLFPKHFKKIMTILKNIKR